MVIRRVASFGDPPRRRKRLKTRGERSRRAASVESSRQSGRSNGKSCHDSGIALMEESSHENSPNSPNISQLHIQEESDQVCAAAFASTIVQIKPNRIKFHISSVNNDPLVRSF